MSEPTEEMCLAARWFILSRDAGIFEWGKLRPGSTQPKNEWIANKIEFDPQGHITKWDFAEGIYRLMEAARNEYREDAK